MWLDVDVGHQLWTLSLFAELGAGLNHSHMAHCILAACAAITLICLPPTAGIRVRAGQHHAAPCAYFCTRQIRSIRLPVHGVGNLPL